MTLIEASGVDEAVKRRGVVIASPIRPLVIIEFEHNQVLTSEAPGEQPRWNTVVKYDVTAPKGLLSFYLLDAATCQTAKGFLGSVTVRPPVRPSSKPHDAWLPVALAPHAPDCMHRLGTKLHVRLLFIAHPRPQFLTRDDFRVTEELGEDEVGQLMFVRKRDTNRLYVMKVVNKECAGPFNSDWLTRCHLTFVVGLKFAVDDGDRCCLVADCVRGGALLSRLADEPGGRLPKGQARRYALQILHGLQELRAVGVSLGIMNPTHVVCDFRGDALLLDFGMFTATGQRGMAEAEVRRADGARTAVAAGMRAPLMRHVRVRSTWRRSCCRRSRRPLPPISGLWGPSRTRHGVRYMLLRTRRRRTGII